MLDRRLVALGAIAAIACSLVGCTQLGHLQSANPNVSSPLTYDYTAIGASDAVGYGSSAPCPTSLISIPNSPDMELMPTPVNCPGGLGYIPDIAGLLSTGANTVNLTDLGISGATVGPTERALGNTYEPLVFGPCSPCVPGDFISDELPLLPSPINTVTIFAGGNDTDAIFAHLAVVCSGGCTPQQFAGFLTADLTNFGNDYATLVGAVHQSFPFAHIYLANLPNFGLTPRGICIGSNPASPPAYCGPNDPALGMPQLQFILDQVTVNMDASVINQFAASGIPVIDLECDGRSYDPNNFYVDGFHPNDAGYKILAQTFAQDIKNYGGPPPQGSCGAYSQSGVRHGFTLMRGIHLKYLRY
jgi:hypothetical protein